MGTLHPDFVRFRSDELGSHRFFSTAVAELAGMMLDARSHRIVVIDFDNRPVGIVTSTDILAALARSDIDQEKSETTRHATA